MLAKKLFNMVTGLYILKTLYWLILEFDVATCAELPHVRAYKRDKADRYNPF